MAWVRAHDARAAAEGAEGSSGTIPILMYHSISPSASPEFARFAVHPREFAVHMAFLARAGYETLTVGGALAEGRRRGSLPSRAVVLTFDDGFSDFHDAALPVLRDNGLTATLYVATGYVGGSAGFLSDSGEQARRMMAWTQLEEAADEGVEVAAHSHTHPQLDRVGPRRLDEEVKRPKDVLEDRLGLRVTSFAYPYGYRNRRARARVAAAGYESACGVDELTASPLSGDLLAMPRLTVNSGTSLEHLDRLLRTRPTAPARAMAGAKRRLWRAVRQVSDHHDR